MTDLTELWNKGELPSGWYWCKCYDEETKLLYYDGDCFELDDPETKNYYFFLKKDVAEISILEKVPSYEEYQKLLSDQLAKIEGEEINAELEAENAQLKELLESALSWLPDSSKLRGGRYAQLQNLKRKISEALK